VGDVGRSWARTPVHLAAYSTGRGRRALFVRAVTPIAHNLREFGAARARGNKRLVG